MTKKKIKEIIISLSLLVIFTFVGILIVKADAFGNGQFYPGGSLGDCSGYNCIWSGRTGVRFSLVDAEGNQVPGTSFIDLWFKDKLGSIGNYDLIKDNGDVIWNFNGALYGNQIKQDVFENPNPGLNEGPYFSLGFVYDFDDVFSYKFDSVYDRWDASWLKHVESYIRKNTSNTNTEVMDKILLKLGFQGEGEDTPTQTSANLGYYLQYEPLVAHGRVGSGVPKNYIFIGTMTEYMKYDLATAGALSPSLFAGSSSRVAINISQHPSKFTTGRGVVDDLLNYRDGKIIGEGVAHIWIRDLVDKSDDLNCTDAINYINEKYTPGTSSYHNQVKKILNGTFSYTDSKGILHKIDGPYRYFYLYEENYMGLPDQKALCKDKDVVTNQCDKYTGYTEILDNCLTGKNYFSDIDEEDAWLKCEIAYTIGSTIYSSDNTGHDAVENENGGIVGNKEYCEVFCYENVETNFPVSVNGVKAGQTFTWGSSMGKFGDIQVHKFCSTQQYKKGQQGYRFEEWSSDYKSNERNLVEHYLKKAAYEKQLANITVSASSECIDDDEPCTIAYRGTATASAKSHSYTDGYLGTVIGKVDRISISTGLYDTSSEAKKAAKEQLITKLEELIESEYREYGVKLGSEENLLVKIRQCTNNIEYMFKTTVNFTFKEPVSSVYGVNSRNFTFNGNLDVIASYDHDNVNTSKCSEEIVYSYDCSGEGTNARCKATVEKVLNCKEVTWELDETYTYNYPADKFKWYSLKTNAELLNQSAKDELSADDAFFYTIGFGLPTAFSLNDGTYKLKVTVSNLGDTSQMQNSEQDYNSPNGHFNPIRESFDYICVYNVENEIFGNDCEYDENGNLTPNSPKYCDLKIDNNPNGSLVELDVAFRLVTLLSEGDSIDKAFPGIDGTGREPHANWMLGDNKIKEILSADKEAFTKDNAAMYEIMLDVNAIQKIRKDNQSYFEAGIDPYTSYVDSSNTQKVYCATSDEIESNQKYCASTYISKLNNAGYLNYPLLGTCMTTNNTLERAEHVLQYGCDGTYTYPDISWIR